MRYEDKEKRDSIKVALDSFSYITLRPRPPFDPLEEFLDNKSKPEKKPFHDDKFVEGMKMWYTCQKKGTIAKILHYFGPEEPSPIFYAPYNINN